MIDAEEDELVKAGLDEVPAQLQPSALERPFQMLVTTTDAELPELTPVFVGITFVLMFDICRRCRQGAALALAGLYFALQPTNFRRLFAIPGPCLRFAVLCRLSVLLWQYFRV